MNANGDRTGGEDGSCGERMAGERNGSLPIPVSNGTVRATYDRWATGYARTVARLEAPSKRRALDLLDLAPGARVLDVGCGPGLTLSDLAVRVGEDGAVYALDASPRMLVEAAGRVRPEARPRVQASGDAGRISFVRGDARDLPVADGALDAVVAFDVLELFDRAALRSVLAEIRRVLAPGGALCAVTMDRAGVENAAFVRAYEWAYRHVPGFARVGCRPFNVASAIRGAGFAIEAVERSRRAGVWPVVTVRCSSSRSDRAERDP